MTTDLDVKAVFDRVGQNLNVVRAFGTPVERDDTLVIPVAFVAGGGGTGRQPEPKAIDSAGIGGVVYPIGVYVVRRGEVRFKPSLDANLFTVLGFLLLSVFLGRGRWHRHRSPGG